MTLSEMRARVPHRDRQAYDAAYAEAEICGRLGEALYALREAAGLSEEQLAERMGASGEEVTAAEEGGPLEIGFLHRACAALGVPGALVLGDHVVALGEDERPGTE